MLFEKQVNMWTLDLASMDEVVEQENNYANENGSWYSVATQSMYGTDNSAEATVTAINKTQLTNLGDGILDLNYAIDIYGNITTTTTSLDRDAKKIITSILHPNSTVAEEQVTINGLRISKRSKTNLTTTYSYDALGRNISITEPRVGTTHINYFANGVGKQNQVQSIVDPANNSTTFDYDNYGRQISQTNALGKVTRYEYDLMGNTIKVWGDSSYPLSFTFDNLGRKITQTTYRDTTVNFGGMTFPTVTGDVTTWSYDQYSGLITVKTDANGKSTQYTYDVNSNLLTRTWARGIITTYNYNNTGKLLKVDYSDDTADVTYTYSRLGKITNIIDAVGTRVFEYNDNFNLTKEQISGIYNKELNYGYTNTGLKGKPLSMSIDNVQNYNYGYDELGRLNQINDINYSYLANSNLLSSVTRPNNINTTWNYEDNRNLVTSLNSSNINISYTNNAIGNRTSMASSDISWTNRKKHLPSSVWQLNPSGRHEIIAV